MAKQFDAIFSGHKENVWTKKVSDKIEKRKIAVFELDRETAKHEVLKQAKLYGFVDATIDHLVEHK